VSADAFAALLAQLPLRREASVELCSERCGAKCCRQRDAVIFMDTAEMRTLKRLGKDHRVSVPVRHEPQRLASSAPWALHFSDTGGKCPFVTDTSLCSIYESRPRACERFPIAPTPGCLLWPAPVEDANPKGDLTWR